MHLKCSEGTSTSLDTQQLRPRRTVDAIVQERQQSSTHPTSIQLQDTVSAARQIKTACSTRLGEELRQPRMTKTTRKIVAVRRATCRNFPRSVAQRRIGKVEAEWIEKQVQYKTRALRLEQECRAAWQTFFASAGSLITSTGWGAAADVNKLMEELEVLRRKDIQERTHHFRQLTRKVTDVQVKVAEMTNNIQLFSELQEAVNAMETALAKLRQDQLQQFEESVLEEKALEKALAANMEKMASWEQATPRRLHRTVSSAFNKPKLAHSRSKASWIGHDILIDQRQSIINVNGTSASFSRNNQEEDRTVTPEASDETAMVDRVRCLNEAIIQSEGFDGCWDAREHATFMALLVKCGLTDDVLLKHLSLDELKSPPHINHEGGAQTKCDFETQAARFLIKCMQKVVTQTRTSVRSHFEWYLHHLELVEEKKHVIQEWKRRKDEERQHLIQCGFDADANVLKQVLRDKVAKSHGDANFDRPRTGAVDQKKLEETEHLLEQWKREIKQKEAKQTQRKRELQSKRDAIEAKRRQMQLNSKQKVLLYKVQKEHEAIKRDYSATHRQAGVTHDVHPLKVVASSSPTPNEELVARAYRAIESAKAKRLRLQQLEHCKQKRQQLPRRPVPKATEEKVKTLAKPVMVYNATAASKARDLSEQEIQGKTRQRECQGAHHAYFSGMKALSDVKIKSFGHKPI